jgi:hypothetical protein
MKLLKKRMELPFGQDPQSYPQYMLLVYLRRTHLQLPRRIIITILCFALPVCGQGNSFDKVRYNGGSVDSKVDPKDWHNHLTVTSDTITMNFKDGKNLEIPAKSVTSISYGQEAHRRVGTMVALAILVSPVALFGLMHKTRLHYIGLQYKTSDSKSAGILLQGDKDNYRAILVALQGVTGVPVSVGEKDREYVPVGVKTEVAKQVEEPHQIDHKSAQTAPPTQTSDSTKGVVNVVSNPASADVLVDGEFVGNSPAVLKLLPGKHNITVKSTGFKDWSKDITVESASDVQLNAVLSQ